MSPADFVGLILLNLLGVVSPGPDVVLITRTATQSRRHAVAVTLGIQMGVVMWCTLTVLGAAAVLNAFPELFGIIQVAGGGWLLWMGFNMIRSGWQARNNPPATLEEAESRLGTLSQAFRHGLTTNLSNPKIVLFLASLIAPLLPREPSPGLAIMVILALSLSSLAMQLFMAIVVSTKQVRRRLLNAGAYIDIGAGVFFLIAGVILVGRGILDILS